MINQFLSSKVITSIPPIPDTWSELSYQRLKDQICLFENVLTASDSELDGTAAGGPDVMVVADSSGGPSGYLCFTRVSGHKKAEYELKTQSRRKELRIHSYRVVCFETFWSSQQWQNLVYDESDSVPHAHAQSF
ncbi:hypothetical protein Tco_1378373 [Tanacetum coccineum]